MNEEHTLAPKDIDKLLQFSDKVAENRLASYMCFLSLSEGLSYIRNHSINKEPYSINIFERYNSDEPTTSWAIAEILKFRYEGTYPLLNSFIDHFLSPIGLSSKCVDNPIITTEKDRIDICVKDDQYAIIFENKIKGANYQPNQIARYIYKLSHLLDKNYDKSNIYIVLMPNYLTDDYIQDIPRSVWRLPKDFANPKHQQQCVIGSDLCWCDDYPNWNKQWDAKFCTSCIKTFKEEYGQHTIVLQHQLSKWLISDCLKLIPTKETILRSFIIQFADYLNLQYGMRENQKLKREMENYLKEKLFNADKSNIDNWNMINDKLDEIKKLEAEVGLLLGSISGDVIDDWYRELLPAWKGYGLRNEKHDYFALRIQGVSVGCWSGKDENNHEQYWAFYSEKGFTLKQQKMIEAILNDTNIVDYKEDNSWYWKYTCDGAEICNDFYNSAIKLGYLEKKQDI